MNIIEYLNTEPNNFKYEEERKPETAISYVTSDILVTDIRKFLGWFNNPNIAGRFDPPIKTYQDCLNHYSKNTSISLVAKDEFSNPLGVLTFEKEDKYYNNFISYIRKTSEKRPKESNSEELLEMYILEKFGQSEKHAYLTKVVVDPDKTGQGIGSQLLAVGLDHFFYDLKYDICTTWVMAGEKSGNWDLPLRFFRKAGFTIMPHNLAQWQDYSKEIEKRGDEKISEALWLYITPELWKKTKKQKLFL
ncbi:MAG: hypothetical protein ACD_12C00623G0001 [uncultured bacterium]|nr:MAG: hypothetical protein ACD_12C00623G0001 [uncultured bacterium]